VLAGLTSRWTRHLHEHEVQGHVHEGEHTRRPCLPEGSARIAV
jgi:hypothetical protein